MATLNSVMAADVASVFLNTDDFASAVYWLPNGETHNRKPVTAVVALQDATLEKGRGRGTHTMAEMVIASTVSVGSDDAFEVNGLRYEVVAVTPAEHGANKVTLSRYVSKHRGGRTAGDI